jgi:hypothetical protein
MLTRGTEESFARDRAATLPTPKMPGPIKSATTHAEAMLIDFI